MHIDGLHAAVNEGIAQKLLGRVAALRHGVRVCDKAVAHLESLFGSLDQSMQVGCPVSLCDAMAQAQAVEDGQNHQRGQALGGRPQVEERGAADPGTQGLGAAGLMRLQVSQAQWAAQALVLSRHGRGNAAAVIVVKAPLGQGLQGARQRRVAP